jgi:hypothetical protein
VPVIILVLKDALGSARGGGPGVYFQHKLACPETPIFDDSWGDLAAHGRSYLQWRHAGCCDGLGCRWDGARMRWECRLHLHAIDSTLHPPVGVKGLDNFLGWVDA